MTQFKRSSPLLTLVIALWTLLGYSLAAAHGQSPASAGDTANARSPLGINIDALTYWSTEWPLLDEMKRSSDWWTQCSRYKSATCAPQAPATEWDTREQSRLDLDPEGRIRSLPAVLERFI